MSPVHHMILSSLSHHASGVRDILLLPLLAVKFSLQLITPFDTSIICLIRNKMNEDSMGMYLSQGSLVENER